MTTFANPRPFVAAVMRLPTLAALLGIAWAIVVLVGVLTDVLFRSEFVAGTQPLPPRALDVTAIQTVSIIGAVLSGFWYWHVWRMLLGVAVWSYPSLGARIRTSFLILAAVLAATGFALATLWLPTTSPWAIAAFAGAWAAWPLLLNTPAPRMVRIGVALGVFLLAALPPPARTIAGQLWPWLAVVAPALGLTAIVFGLSPAMVRRMVLTVQPNPNAGTWLAATEDDAVAQPTRVLTSVPDRARAIERALVARWARPRWMPARFSFLMGGARWVAFGLIYHFFTTQGNSIILLAFAFSGVSMGTDLWWPLGRAERLQLAQRHTLTGMVVQGGLLFGVVALLELLAVPPLPLFEGNRSLLNSWVLLPSLISVLPFVYSTQAVPGLAKSMWGQVGRLCVAFVFVHWLTLRGLRAEQPATDLWICAAVFVLALAEQQWRLRRHFLRGDLNVVRA